MLGAESANDMTEKVVKCIMPCLECGMMLTMTNMTEAEQLLYQLYHSNPHKNPGHYQDKLVEVAHYLSKKGLL
jgi:hypothetical protein